MTEESPTTSHLSAAMTTTGMTQITGGNTLISSPSRAIEVYFHCALIVIGVVGTATNGLIIYALVASKQHKKLVLIVNQNALDLFTSIMMIVDNTFMLCNIDHTGSAGYWLCTLLHSEIFFWCGINGSVINLACITVDRYLKVVHSVWSKKKVKNWMIHSAMAFSWIGSFIYNVALVFPTSAVIDGVCYVYMFYESKAVHIFYSFFNFVSFYAIILFIFIFCYWRILVIIRRQAKVMAGHAAAGPSTSQTYAQAQSNKIQSNIIKTMILVSALYAIMWLPNNIFLLFLSLNPNRPPASGFYTSVIVAFLYMCINPFIYAINFDPVKEVLLRLIPCKKNSG